MNFKDKRIEFRPAPIARDPYIQSLIEKRLINLVPDRPDEKEFIGIYSEEEINNDLAEVNRLEGIFNTSETKNEYAKNISSIYEIVLTDQIESNAWFGENCETFPASKYDDIKNGIDSVCVFKGEEDSQYLGLGMDVTFTSDSKDLINKLDSIKNCIRSGELPSIKYFKNPHTGDKKKIFLPKVIVGSRFASAEKLIRLWADKSPDRNKKLQSHPVSSKLILEIIVQLRYFSNFALRQSEHANDDEKSNSYYKIALAYAQMNNIFFDIYQEKKKTIDLNMNELSDDIVYETILKYADRG